MSFQLFNGLAGCAKECSSICFVQFVCEVQLAAVYFFFFSDFTNLESQNGFSVGSFATMAKSMARASVRLV